MPNSTRPFKPKEKALNRINQINYATVEDAAAGINPLPEVALREPDGVAVCCRRCRTEIHQRTLPKKCPVCWKALGVE